MPTSTTRAAATRRPSTRAASTRSGWHPRSPIAPTARRASIELIRLLDAHRTAGSALAGRLLDEADLAARFWLVEPIDAPPVAPVASVTADRGASQPDRNPNVPVSVPTPDAVVPSLERTWGGITPG